MAHKLNKGIKIDGDTIIICQWCQHNNTLTDWDKNTFKECVSREMRRTYMSLNSSRAFLRQSEKFYKCPSCGKWLKGSQLIIHHSHPMASRLGGDPIITISKNRDD